MPQLRARLYKTGDYQEPSNANQDSKSKSLRYRGAIVEAVKRFQERHCLYVDGVIGINTLTELNVSVDKRIDQILVNLERQRWMPPEFGDRYVMINIPEFTLRAYCNRQQKENMRVVVGNAEKKTTTPVIHNPMKHVIFRPYWECPI